MSLIWLGETPELDRELVGGKALSINKMRSMGLPVPPAFTLSTAFCAEVLESGGELTPRSVEALREGLARLEEETGLGLGNPEKPLLVSVRSGGAQSMPGMMDTILNLGMNDGVEKALGEKTGDADFAVDTHRRYREQFERVVQAEASGDAWADLLTAAAAVFRSWESPRAVAYRKHQGIPETGGTAVTVQAMVFGNYDADSGTGVLFTRNPLNGDGAPYGEWLPRGQGEDVVSGRFDALPLETLEARMPEVHRQLLDAAAILEAWGRDAQDIEFTIESGKLWLLQTRAAKRSPEAAVRIAVVLEEAGIVSRAEASALVTPEQIEAVMRPHIDPTARASARLIARGEPASPGVAVGRIVANCEDAEDLADEGLDVVLARPTTDPDDVAGMMVSKAIITEIGGATSHAAVVSRELGIPCVVGAGQGAFAGLTGRVVTVDGTTGEVFEGALDLVSHDPGERGVLGALAGASRPLQSQAVS